MSRSGVLPPATADTHPALHREGRGRGSVPTRPGPGGRGFGRTPRVGPGQGRLGEERLPRAGESASADARSEEAIPSGGERPPDGTGGGRLALGDVVARAWEGLLAAGSAACPVCSGPMTLDDGQGRCEGCGAKLS